MWQILTVGFNFKLFNFFKYDNKSSIDRILIFKASKSPYPISKSFALTMIILAYLETGILALI